MLLLNSCQLYDSQSTVDCIHIQLFLQDPSTYIGLQDKLQDKCLPDLSGSNLAETTFDNLGINLDVE